MCERQDFSPSIHNRQMLVARKIHICTACEETIRQGQKYVRTSQLFDGSWDTWKYCLRCDAMAQEIFRAFNHAIAIDPALVCGEDWTDTIGALPDHVAALAFWLPGEPLPTKA